jgi:hypothetical protein
VTDERELMHATDMLRRLVREDEDVKIMISAACDRVGCDDLFAWAAERPEEVIMMAAQVVDLSEQLGEFDRRLSTGDLS